MKNFLLLGILILCAAYNYAQVSNRISTIDFVQVLDDNHSEVKFYYENNWKILREMAIKKGQIESFEIIETSSTPEAPFNLILKTTYSDKEQYDLREEHFQELIKKKGELKLLNDKKPAEFRKTIFNKEGAIHWN